MTAPFRPSADDLARIGRDVAPIPAIQDKLIANHPKLTIRDRVAHQYQVAGGRVRLRIADTLPEGFSGVGLFEPGAEFTGIGRISTGLGCPHVETDPDFLGLMVAFRTRRGERVDFLTINDPTSPTDTHPQFVKLLDATADAAGAQAPFASGIGELNLPDLLASNTQLVRSLTRSVGLHDGGRIALHVSRQTARTAASSSAYQTYWTGIAEVGGALGKFMFVPLAEENRLRGLRPGERHLSDEWRARQARGEIVFTLHWLPFVDEATTSTTALMTTWVQRPARVGEVIFPQTDPTGEEAQLLAALAAELGANAGNWVADAGNTIGEPGTAFACARKQAYRLSQAGRNALPEQAYAHVFRGEPVGETLGAELRRRRAAKAAVQHMDMAP